MYCKTARILYIATLNLKGKIHARIAGGSGYIHRLWVLGVILIEL